MNKVFDELVNKGGIPDRDDISRLLASIGNPGMEQDEKRLAVKQLYEALGYSGTNSQGHAIWDDLDDYGTF